MSMSSSISQPMTAGELLELDLPYKSTELDRGQLIVHEPPSTRHGGVSALLAHYMLTYTRQHGSGAVYGQDTGFHIFSDPDTVRAPDAAFVRSERVPLVPERGYARIAPDLVAEIVSPDDSRRELMAKVGDWLDAGVRLVWVIDPMRRAAQAYRGDGDISIIGADGALDGADVLPGFRCALAELLGD